MSGLHHSARLQSGLCLFLFLPPANKLDRVGKAIRSVGQESVQIHGGIGVTNELDVGHYFKRVTALEIMFGNTDYHTERFASL